MKVENRPRSIYQYSNMAPRLTGQTSIFRVAFFVSLLGIDMSNVAWHMINFSLKLNMTNRRDVFLGRALGPEVERQIE